jgi:hypothetical protein
LLARPGVDEIMLDLLYDIRNNRQTVTDARQFFKTHQRQVMIATGVNDPLFPGVSMKPPADMPEIEFHPIDSGHFALEDHCAEIGRLTRGLPPVTGLRSWKAWRSPIVQINRPDLAY